MKKVFHYRSLVAVVIANCLLFNGALAQPADVENYTYNVSGRDRPDLIPDGVAFDIILKTFINHEQRFNSSDAQVIQEEIQNNDEFWAGLNARYIAYMSGFCDSYILSDVNVNPNALSQAVAGIDTTYNSILGERLDSVLENLSAAGVSVVLDELIPEYKSKTNRADIDLAALAKDSPSAIKDKYTSYCKNLVSTEGASGSSTSKSITYKKSENTGSVIILQ